MSALLLLIASAGLIHCKLKKLYPQSPALLQLLVPLMYVCSFVNFTGFFRSSKPAVSFLLLWIFFNIAAMLNSPEKISGKLLPTTSWELIAFVRKSGEILK